MVEPVRHRQTKEAATDMFSLPPPRHISTLPTSAVQLAEMSTAVAIETNHPKPASVTIAEVWPTTLQIEDLG
jgi:hypothetical protein